MENVDTIQKGQAILDSIGDRLTSEQFRVLCSVSQMAWDAQGYESDDESESLGESEDDEPVVERTTVNVFVRPDKTAAWVSVILQGLTLVAILTT